MNQSQVTQQPVSPPVAYTQMAGQQEQYIPPKRSVWKIVLVVVVILIVLGVGVWFFLFRAPVEEAVLEGVPETTTTPEVVSDPVDEFNPDQDFDGILDVEEEKLGTSNRDFDTDGDTLSDKSEIEYWKTDPLNPDTDGDGFPDGLEIIRGFNPLGSGKLNE